MGVIISNAYIKIALKPFFYYQPKLLCLLKEMEQKESTAAAVLLQVYPILN